MVGDCRVVLPHLHAPRDGCPGILQSQAMHQEPRLCRHPFSLGQGALSGLLLLWEE